VRESEQRSSLIHQSRASQPLQTASDPAAGRVLHCYRAWPERKEQPLTFARCRCAFLRSGNGVLLSAGLGPGVLPAKYFLRVTDRHGAPLPRPGRAGPSEAI
jgi:hypothetical protein